MHGHQSFLNEGPGIDTLDLEHRRNSQLPLLGCQPDIHRTCWCISFIAENTRIKENSNKVGPRGPPDVTVTMFVELLWVCWFDQFILASLNTFSMCVASVKEVRNIGSCLRIFPPSCTTYKNYKTNIFSVWAHCYLALIDPGAEPGDAATPALLQRRKNGRPVQL